MTRCKIRFRPEILYRVAPCLLLVLLWPSIASAQSRSPNVIVFVMDDMGFGDLRALNPEGCYTPTPQLDQLINRGVCFTHAHSSSSVCAPSRYSLLTGNHAYRGTRPMGTWKTFCNSQIRPGQRTLADVLRSNGYATAFFGKLHLGGVFQQSDGSAATDFRNADLTRRFLDGPLDHGFDYSLTLPAGIQASPYAFFENDRLARWDQQTRQFKHFESDEEARSCFVEQRVGKDQRAYRMDNWNYEAVGPLLMNRALAYIDRHTEKHGTSRPFYIHYCSQAGHSPFSPPEAFNVADPMDTHNRSRPGAIAVMGQSASLRTDTIYEGDVSIRLFVRKLQEKGIFDNTLIVFTSDNGASAARELTWDNAIHVDRRFRNYGGNRTEHHPTFPERKHVNGQGVGHNGVALRGSKGLVYEGGHRIPLIFFWNSVIPAGKKIDDQLIALHDLFRTIAKLTNSPVDQQDARDSVDFTELILNPDSATGPLREALYIQSNRPRESGATWKGENTWAGYSCQPVSGNSTNRHRILKLVLATDRDPLDAAQTAPYELFDLTADPGEQTPVDDQVAQNKILERFHDMMSKARAGLDGR